MNEITNVAIDLTPLLQAVIALLSVVITVYVIPAIKARTTSEQQAMLRDVVHIGVYAAEKIYGGGRGEEKLEYAERYILDHYNAKVDMGALRDMIDAEIKDMELKDLTVIMDGPPKLEDEETEDDEEPDTPDHQEV